MTRKDTASFRVKAARMSSSTSVRSGVMASSPWRKAITSSSRSCKARKDHRQPRWRRSEGAPRPTTPTLGNRQSSTTLSPRPWESGMGNGGNGEWGGRFPIPTIPDSRLPIPTGGAEERGTPSKPPLRPELKLPARQDGIHHVALGERQLVAVARVRDILATQAEQRDVLRTRAGQCARLGYVAPAPIQQMQHVDRVETQLDALAARERNASRQAGAELILPRIAACVARQQAAPVRTQTWIARDERVETVVRRARRLAEHAAPARRGHVADE